MKDVPHYPCSSRQRTFGALDDQTVQVSFPPNCRHRVRGVPDARAARTQFCGDLSIGLDTVVDHPLRGHDARVELAHHHDVRQDGASALHFEPPARSLYNSQFMSSLPTAVDSPVRCPHAQPRACNQHGIYGRSLNAWPWKQERRDGSDGQPASPVRLVELVPREVSALQARYVVGAGKFTVEVDANFDSVTRCASV